MASNLSGVLPLESSDQAVRIEFFNFRTPPMRAFHLAWAAFFVCFFAWFACAPLMPVIRGELGLSMDQIANINIAAVTVAILARLIVGPLCDRYGPRKTYTGLMLAGAIPVFGVAAAQTYESFLFFRLLIGMVGASFVITQYHTSVMFAPNVVGAANATTAGWGNAGGGAAQTIMPLALAGVIALGVNPAFGWRVSLLLPGVLMLVMAYLYWRCTQDGPAGNFSELRGPGTDSRPAGSKGWASLRRAGANYRVWMLFITYAACFGVEIFIHNIAASYYVDRYGLSLTAAGLAAGSFGLLALCARPFGGWLSDNLAARRGLNGRTGLLCALLVGEGAALFGFAQMHGAGPAFAVMLLFGLFTHMACGATYALVPFIDRGALGGVAGIIGAGGNVGAVAAGFLMKSVGDAQSCLTILGAMASVSAVCAAAMRFSGAHQAREDELYRRSADAAAGARQRRRMDLVVIGNGMAGARTIEELLQLAPDRYRITVFGAEPYGNYNRILLSPMLAGEKRIDEIMLNTVAWYEQNDIKLYAGDPVVRIDRGRRMVHSQSGREVPYDRLLLATGSRPFMLPVPGNNLPGVVTFRDIQDVETMLQSAREHRNAVVIGGGLLGLEAANGLQRQGMEVTVVHLLETLMERQLDAAASRLLQRSLEERGIRFRMRARTEALLGGRRVSGVRFSDGSELTADLVVMAVGIQPNTALARDCGLHCEKGIVVDDTLQTFDPRIYAVGECVQHRATTYGLVAPLWEQARVCASHLAQVGTGRYAGTETSTKLKVTGIDVYSAGDIVGGRDSEEIVFRDPQRGVYKRIIIQDNRVRGAVLYGDTADGGWYFQLLRERRDVSAFRERLIFGRGFAENKSAAGGQAETDGSVVCDCNGICKGAIVTAIRSLNLRTQAEVEKQTKAGSSCGSCRPKVLAVLTETLGYVVTPAVTREQPMCECTALGHGQVRAAIREQRLFRAADVRVALDWRRPDGCHKCRPALNYYVLSTFPEQAEDDPQSRFINERAHANIQKDGTFSVVPRMWGGLTNARELRAIADVVEKYRIPTVKVTGGQRIDLLGVKKEELPLVWRDLREQGGLISGYAYGKALRTVKTCVGREWCRFGLQESTKLGVDIEKMTWGAWTPHKVKMAVSGCPRNCAEAGIKDFGVVCLESGYELHVGGNGGIKLRGTDVLCRVTTPEEVLEHCGAFLQTYREEAYYLERTAHWIERVGIDYIRARVAGDAGERRAAYERFRASQLRAQVDPWEQRSAPDACPPEYLPLKEIV
jgi:nitrite reductase (NADH) large subunit